MNISVSFGKMAIDIARYLQNHGIDPTRIDIDDDGISIDWYDGQNHRIILFYRYMIDDLVLIKEINGVREKRYEFTNLNDVYQQIIYIINHTKPYRLF